ncbi:PREDICTED: semaphorin-2A-like [Priapulus caudatus]|uniref:Semaphorin-2A-like n=1 Tax=Priapulus caudatus TaxID=37621 RepID=A0ABM1E6L4_PRICU|nr:PREDICTED: semaphorin-2A-like [Priapulus caudatus]
MVAVPGQTLHLRCPVTSRDSLQPALDVSWYHDDKLITYDDLNLLTTAGGLVLVTVTHLQRAGVYRCELSGQTVASYAVLVNNDICKVPVTESQYQAKYSDWCQEFETYRSNLASWAKLRKTCGSR